MNRTEKLICLVLGSILAWYVFVESPKSRQRAAESTRKAESRSAALSNEVVSVAAPAAAEAAPVKIEVPAEPEKTVLLENDEVAVELSSWGAVVKNVTLKKFGVERGAPSDENPAMAMDFSDVPLGAIKGSSSIAQNASYKIAAVSSNSVTFVNDKVSRTVSVEPGYRISYEDSFSSAEKPGSSVTLGSVKMGGSKNDLLSVDSMAAGGGKDQDKVVHHCEGDSPLKAYLVGGAGGCSGSSAAAGMPATVSVGIPGEQKYLAVKNRFFVSAICSSSVPINGFSVDIKRNMSVREYRPESVAAAAEFGEIPSKRSMLFYVGPKKQSLLWDLGMQDVMEFGMWRWLCYPLVWVLNTFHNWVPNFGVAIILLTVLVRILFWPLTHKSTVGMKKMQEIQPKLKELQAKFKDNPQRLQQETFALYKAEKVNPLSSCLPMLVQIPVFIALFNVLRSAVELRYAEFLWISDLSEPEGLFAAYLPFGGLNILPILMAVTTALQSAFTPSGGDKNQQKMMMVFMPLMMLVMFYSFPSALSLYWFLSNIFSIVQMWLIRRAAARKREAGILTPEVIDPPVTRQMRRHRG